MMTRATLSALTEEAIAWFVRTHSDQRTLADEDRFAQWLKQDPQNAEAYARVEQVWRVAGSSITPRAIAGENRSRLGVHARRRAFLAIAATLAMIIVGVGQFMSERGSIRTGTFATEAGGQRELKLADGSKILLNTRSEVIVSFDREQRSIRLTRGEARFQVAKDATRPFIVDAGAARVRAVGTSFDVRVSPARLAVTLVEGLVEVIPTQAAVALPEAAVLSAGQQLSFEVGTGEQRVDTVNLQRAGAWTHQQLVFDAVTLSVAVEEANRYLRMPIVIGEPSLNGIRVSGVVRAGNVASFVDTLAAAFAIEAIAQPEGGVLLMPRDEAAHQQQ